MFESAYELLLARKLVSMGFDVVRQASISFEFDGIDFRNAFRVDLLIEQRVVVEIKTVDRLKEVHHQQLLTYLRLMDLRVGLLINFREPLLKDGIKRVVNDLPPDDSPILRVNQRN